MKRQPAKSQSSLVAALVVGMVVLCALAVFANLFASPPIPAAIAEPVKREQAPNTFLYFAYASDLLESRLKSGGGPSAEFVGMGKVRYRRFAYSQESKVWKGGVADIVLSNDEGEEVYGVVYRLRDEDLSSMDKQKGVGKTNPLYERISVMVETTDGTLECISYAMVESRRDVVGFSPSIQYRKCILNGAKQAKLPKPYIKQLERIKDNGNAYERRGVSC
ncbi:hypothetical protein BASA81_008736 [Batrachochytrium salamandrivorans]|nr:hypothetical protein BASA81_008736 [Batrachochytrium salamandrivorans]